MISYTDFFAVTSVEDVAQRIAKSIYKMLKPHDGLFKKALKVLKTFRPSFQPTMDGTGFNLTIQQANPGLSGIDLLERTMEDLGEFLRSTEELVQITFDEFQEITELNDGQIEGVLRKHIQEHRASYFFVGSRKRVLLDMFAQQKRPFYQSALLYKLEVLPREELKVFLKEKFLQTGKDCPETIIDDLLDRSCCHPYYSQNLAFFVFQHLLAENQITDNDFQAVFSDFLESEAMVFESVLQGLRPQQIALLKALAREPSGSILSAKYMQGHQLKSIGGIQAAVKKLVTLDLIEKDDDQAWCLVDPILRFWLAGM
ncbi:MAG: hypothetical protein R6V54_04505 [Desulfobacteraceae bacterium]